MIATQQMVRMNKQICIQINDNFGVTNPGGNPPQASGSQNLSGYAIKFTGSYAQDYSVQSGGSVDNTILTATPAACFEGGGSPPVDTFHFYQVLLAR